MRQKSGHGKTSAEKVIKDIRRVTRKQYSAEEKIRIVLEGLRGEETIAALCRREDSEDAWDVFHYVALFRSRVLGALSFEYYFRVCICYVNYLLIDGQSRLACSNTDHIARSLISRFRSLSGRMSCSRVKNAKYILFDLGPEKSYRAKCRHFVKLVGKADKCACKIQYRFLQPNYPRKGLVHEPIER